MASKLDQAKQALQRDRAKRKAQQSNTLRRTSTYLTAWALGSMTQRGTIDRIPSIIPGVPRTFQLALGALLLGTMLPARVGRFGDVLEGVGDAAFTVGLFQFGAGQEIAGMQYPARMAPRAIGAEAPSIAQLENELRNELEMQLVAEQAAMNDPGLSS